jgi:hypothetical protein
MGTPPHRPLRGRDGNARMVVGEIRGRLAGDEGGGREWLGAGRSVGREMIRVGRA